MQKKRSKKSEKPRSKHNRNVQGLPHAWWNFIGVATWGNVFWIAAGWMLAPAAAGAVAQAQMKVFSWVVSPVMSPQRNQPEELQPQEKPLRREMVRAKVPFKTGSEEHGAQEVNGRGSSKKRPLANTWLREEMAQSGISLKGRSKRRATFRRVGIVIANKTAEKNARTYSR
jgi:phosphate/sulfate permease